MAMLKERMSHLQQAGAEAGPSSKEAQVRSQGRRGPLLSPHVSLAHPPPGQPQPWQCGHACQWACQGPATCIRGKPTPRCSWCRPAQRDCLHCLCWACAPAPSPCLWLPEILLAGCSTSPCGHLSATSSEGCWCDSPDDLFFLRAVTFPLPAAAPAKSPCGGTPQGSQAGHGSALQQRRRGRTVSPWQRARRPQGGRQAQRGPGGRHQPARCCGESCRQSSATWPASASAAAAASQGTSPQGRPQGALSSSYSQVHDLSSNVLSCQCFSLAELPFASLPCPAETLSRPGLGCSLARAFVGSSGHSITVCRAQAPPLLCSCNADTLADTLSAALFAVSMRATSPGPLPIGPGC